MNDPERLRRRAEHITDHLLRGGPVDRGKPAKAARRRHSPGEHGRKRRFVEL